jgi:hypothetical protein
VLELEEVVDVRDALELNDVVADRLVLCDTVVVRLADGELVIA